jgi:hypothetical protein
MAGLSAGEVFVTLSVKSGGVKPALEKASAQLRGFGKSLTALSVATGSLIADGLKFAFSKVKDVAAAAFEAAKLDPRTAKDTERFKTASDGLFKSLSTLGATLMSLILPTLTKMTEGLTWVVDSINEATTYFESFGAVAALQTGDIGTAVDILWKEIQIAFLEGSQALLGLWDGMTGGFISAWQSMSSTLLTILGDVFSQAGNTVSGFIIGLKVISPQIAAQLGPLEQLGSALQQAGKISNVAGSAAATAAAKEAEQRRQQAEEGQRILQDEIDALRKQVTSQTSQAVTKRDLKRATDAAVATQQEEIKTQGTVSGTSSAFALAAGGGNVQFQTQKDLLKEAKESKEIAKKNLEQLTRIANGGMVFG